MITFENVCKSFDGRAVLDKLSLTLNEGCITCITGRSGCGKTTLLRLIMGLETPDSGKIVGIEALKTSAVFQEDRLCMALSASANAAIALKKGAPRSISDDILRELGLGDDLFKPVSDMSGGMRRRVAIARALSAEYDILILDEPFTGLDAATRDRTLECILRHSDRKTVLLVTHDPEVPALVGGNIFDLELFSPQQL